MVPEIKAPEKYSVIFIVSVFILYLCSVAAAGTVVIKPGQFDHFTLQMPERAVAGENFIIKLSAYDASNNLITNFSETGKEFRVDVNGSAITQPSFIGASSFSGGLANIVVSDRKAEKITVSVREAGGSVPVITGEIIVSPNRLDHFIVQSPASVTAGVSFDVKVIARDSFENTVQDFDIGKNIKLMTAGTSAVRLLGGEAIDFKNGVASAIFVSEKAGDVVIEFQDTPSGSRGKTQGIQVNPAGLAYFKLQAPKAVVAGEPFELLISAYDIYDNVIANYASAGSGVRLTATGSSKIEPATVNPSEFRNGQALVKVVYEKAELIQLSARELNRDQSGKTADISVTNAPADHFVVLTPDTAVSGQKFKIKVEAYDRFNNIAGNFNLNGFDVILASSGNGFLNPSRLSPSDFTNGIAVAEVTYDRAESFQISARLATDRSTGRISTSVREVKRDVAQTPAMIDRTVPARTIEYKPTAVKKEVKKTQTTKPEQSASAQKKKTKKTDSGQKSNIASSEAGKKEPKKDVVKKTDVKKVEPKKETAKKETAKETPSVKPVEKRPAKTTSDEQQKTASVTSIREEKKIDKALYNINKVSIIEAKNKAMLVINIANPNGNLNYGDEIESRNGKEWLKLKIRPAVNSTEKAFKFTSQYIGEMLIEEDKAGLQNQLYIYVELLPVGIAYDIARIKNTLVITFSTP